MPHRVQGDLNVKRKGFFERRSDQGRRIETALAAQLDLTDIDHHWIRAQTDGNGAQDVVLPDASTLDNPDSESIAWQVVVHNYGTADSLNVKTYHASTPVLLKEVTVGRAYLFTLVDNPDSAGIWHVNWLEEHDDEICTRYAQTYNDNTSWGSLVTGYYYINIPGTTHLRGSNPIFQLFKKEGTDYEFLNVDRARVENDDDIVFRVPAGLRYEGKIVVL